jgi:hypothetical protein
MAYAAAGTRPGVERLEREAIDAAMARVTLVARAIDALFIIPGSPAPASGWASTRSWGSCRSRAT